MAISTVSKSSGKEPRVPEQRSAPADDGQAQRMAVMRDERVNEAARRQLIEEEAYHRAERRGFAPGGELDDWLAAEAKVDLSLSECRVIAVS
jgi:hypothetical protein